VVADAQLNRDPDGLADHRPQLADLRESGDLEQTADLVAFIYSDFYYDDNLKGEDIWDSEILIAKQRNGGTGKCKLKFRKPQTQFVNVTTHSTLDN
jgi:replicative DNA helicase